MGFKREQAPGDLDAEGLRKFTEGQLLKIQRATADMDTLTADLQTQITALQTSVSALEKISFGQCKLIYVDSTHIKLIPFNGNKIRINGVFYDIPAAGITIDNTGFAASTLYYIYVRIVAGALALYGNSTGHTTSTTAGNVGTEIFNYDDNYTLVGMVRTDSAATFFDNSQVRWVRSWFNDTGVMAISSSGTLVSTSSTSFIELDSAVRQLVLGWAGEYTTMTVSVMCSANAAGTTVYTIPWIDGSANGIYGFMHNSDAFYYQNVNIPWTFFNAVDTTHTLSIGGQVGGGTGSWSNKMISTTTVRR